MEEQTMINRAVQHPPHYNQYPIEVIDMMERIFGTEKTIDWCIMTAFKYRMRLGHKDDIQQELAKENWYLTKANELLCKKKDRECKDIPCQVKLKAISDAVNNAQGFHQLLTTLQDILNA